MSFANYQVGELWKSFASRRKEITSNLTEVSLLIYSPTHFINFNFTNEFERWATVEVANFDNVPIGMKTLCVAK